MVILRNGQEPAQIMGQNLCGESGQRAFMASLLRTIARAHPAGIAIDKWYAQSSCPAGDLGTKKLQCALAEISTDVSIVLGAKAENERDIERRSRPLLSELKRKGFRSYELLGEARLPLGEDPALPNVRYGILTLDYDVRKIPLSWPVYASEQDVGKPGQPAFLPSLSLVAAQEHDPSAAKDLTRNPFTGFLNETELNPYSAIDLICGPGAAPSSDWRTCQPGQVDRQALADLKSHLVIVGEDNPNGDDFFETPTGQMPGVLLQANYIESMLDDRYLRSGRDWLIWVLSGTWFVLIELTFHIFSSNVLRALVVACGVTAVLGLLFYNVAVVDLGYYLALWPTGVVAVALRFALAFVAAGEHGNQQRSHDRKKVGVVSS
ncbi:MAG: CHASE2 domain-containing protein [Acidobacteria bacterium]|nr:CHASE2 domain-containing protein [Acidobacteriota bacterium]